MESMIEFEFRFGSEENAVVPPYGTEVNWPTLDFFRHYDILLNVTPGISVLGILPKITWPIKKIEGGLDE